MSGSAKAEEDVDEEHVDADMVVTTATATAEEAGEDEGDEERRQKIAEIAEQVADLTRQMNEVLDTEILTNRPETIEIPGEQEHQWRLEVMRRQIGARQAEEEEADGSAAAAAAAAAAAGGEVKPLEVWERLGESSGRRLRAGERYLYCADGASAEGAFRAVPQSEMPSKTPLSLDARAFYFLDRSLLGRARRGLSALGAALSFGATAEAPKTVADFNPLFSAGPPVLFVSGAAYDFPVSFPVDAAAGADGEVKEEEVLDRRVWSVRLNLATGTLWQLLSADFVPGASTPGATAAVADAARRHGQRLAGEQEADDPLIEIHLDDPADEEVQDPGVPNHAQLRTVEVKVPCKLVWRSFVISLTVHGPESTSQVNSSVEIAVTPRSGAIKRAT